MSEFTNSQNRMHQQNMLNLQRGQNLHLKQIEENLQLQVDAIKSVADSAEETASSSNTLAESAKKIANKADIKGWIAVAISALTFLLELSGRLGLF